MILGNKNTVIVLLVLLILAVAVFFRFGFLSTTPPGLYPDEAVNGTNALEAAQTGEYSVFYPDNNGREGLYINIQALFFKVFGRSVEVLRSVSAVFGVLGVLGTFFLIKILWGPRLALLATYLTAIGFWAVNFSRIGFRAIMLPAVLVWSFWLLWLGLKKQKGWAVFVSGLILGVGFHTYISARIAPLLVLFLFLLFLFVNKELATKKVVKFFAVFIVGAFLTASPLLLYYAQNPGDFLGRAGQVSVFEEESAIGAFGGSVVKTLGMFNVVGDFNWRHNLSGRPLLFWPIGIGFVIGLLIVLSKLFKRKETKYQFLLAWFFIMLLPNFFAPEGAPHALRAMGALPAVYIMSAIGLNWIYEKAQKYFENQKSKHEKYKPQLTRIKREVLVLAMGILVFFGVWEGRVYFLNWGLNQNTAGAFNQNLVNIGNYLNTTDTANRYVIVNEGGALVDGIHIPAKTIEFIVWPERNDVVFVNGEDVASLPANLKDATIVMVREDTNLINQLSRKYPEAQKVINPNFSRLIIPPHP